MILISVVCSIAVVSAAGIGVGVGTGIVVGVGSGVVDASCFKLRAGVPVGRGGVMTPVGAGI